MIIPDGMRASGEEAATAFAPASIGNMAVGYDVLGCAFGAVGDRVRVRRIAEPTVRVGSITGRVTDLPRDPEANTATVGLLRLIEDAGLPFGFAVDLEKGIPLGSGMGGSAASAVAGIVAAAALVEPALSPDALLHYALEGEQVASGARHADNVAPSLHGGLVLTTALDPPAVVPIPVPDAIRIAMVRPNLEIATHEARQVVPRTIPLETAVQQSAHLAGFIAGCYRGDLELIRRTLRDVLIEPHRAPLIPGFAAVRDAALEAGALGSSISGAGPTIFAWCDADETATAARQSMVEAFGRAGIEAEGWTGPPALRGAYVEPASTSESA